MIATLLTAEAGLAVTPIVIVAVVVATITSIGLSAYVDARVGRDTRTAEHAPAVPAER